MAPVVTATEYGKNPYKIRIFFQNKKILLEKIAFGIFFLASFIHLIMRLRIMIIGDVNRERFAVNSPEYSKYNKMTNNSRNIIYLCLVVQIFWYLGSFSGARVAKSIESKRPTDWIMHIPQIIFWILFVLGLISYIISLIMTFSGRRYSITISKDGYTIYEYSRRYIISPYFMLISTLIVTLISAIFYFCYR